MNSAEVVQLLEIYERTSAAGELLVHIRDEALKRLREADKALAPKPPTEPVPAPTTKGKGQ